MSTAAKEKEGDVRQRILQEAMTRFAHKGSELTTVREITEATQVNVAAINYHFGSKEGLLKAVLDAVLQPLNAERSRLLDDAERQWGDSLPLSALLDALLRPLVQSARTPDGGRIAVRLLQHLRATPQGEVSLLLSDHFDGTAHRFIQAFVRAVPHISRAEAIWRYEFARGAAMHVLADVDPRSGRLTLLSQGLCDSNDDEQVLQQLLRFVSAGFAAPSANAVPTE